MAKVNGRWAIGTRVSRSNNALCRPGTPWPIAIDVNVLFLTSLLLLRLLHLHLGRTCYVRRKPSLVESFERVRCIMSRFGGVACLTKIKRRWTSCTRETWTDDALCCPTTPRSIAKHIYVLFLTNLLLLELRQLLLLGRTCNERRNAGFVKSLEGVRNVMGRLGRVARFAKIDRARAFGTRVSRANDALRRTTTPGALAKEMAMKHGDWFSCIMARR